MPHHYDISASDLLQDDPKKKRPRRSVLEEVKSEPAYQHFGTSYKSWYNAQGLSPHERAVADSVAKYGGTTSINMANLDGKTMGLYHPMGRRIEYAPLRSRGAVAHELGHDVETRLKRGTRVPFSMADLREIEGEGEEFWENVNKETAKRRAPYQHRIDAAERALELLKNFEPEPHTYPGSERIADSLSAAFMTMFAPKFKQPVSKEMMFAAQQALKALKEIEQPVLTPEDQRAILRDLIGN